MADRWGAFARHALGLALVVVVAGCGGGAPSTSPVPTIDGDAEAPPSDEVTVGVDAGSCLVARCTAVASCLGAPSGSRCVAQLDGLGRLLGTYLCDAGECVP